MLLYLICKAHFIFKNLRVLNNVWYDKERRKENETRNERKEERSNLSVIYLTGSKGRSEDHGEKDSNITGYWWKVKERWRDCAQLPRHLPHPLPRLLPCRLTFHALLVRLLLHALLVRLIRDVGMRDHRKINLNGRKKNIENGAIDCAWGQRSQNVPQEQKLRRKYGSTEFLRISERPFFSITHSCTICRKKYKSANYKEKHGLRSALTSRLLRKYNLVSMLRETLGSSHRQLSTRLQTTHI